MSTAKRRAVSRQLNTAYRKLVGCMYTLRQLEEWDIGCEVSNGTKRIFDAIGKLEKRIQATRDKRGAQQHSEQP